MQNFLMFMPRKKNDCLLFSIDALSRMENISHVNLADSRDQLLYSQ